MGFALRVLMRGFYMMYIQYAHEHLQAFLFKWVFSLSESSGPLSERLFE